MSLLSLRPGQVGGAETYVRQLVAKLPEVAAADERLMLVMDRDVAAELTSPGWDRVLVPRSAARIVADRVLEAFAPWRARGIERTFGEIGADVVFYPQQSIFPKRAPGPAVVTVGDVQHLFHPENIPLFERAFRPAIYPYSMKRAARLIAVSNATRDALVERCGIPANKVDVVHHGYEANREPALPTELVSGRYLYYPAATFPHKNHAELLRSYAVLRRRGDTALKLVFTGMQTPAWKGLRRLAERLGVAADVVHLGFLPYGEVRRVFAGAEAVLFPSRYEGFGIPVIEAAVEFGKKVITSRLAVFDEIGVPAERQIDFASPEALIAALRSSGPTALERAPSTWSDCARKTLLVLRASARNARLDSAPDGS